MYVEDRKPDALGQKGLMDCFLAVKSNYHRLFLHLTYFELWSTGFGQAMVLLPIIVLIGPVLSGRCASMCFPHLVLTS